MKSSANLLSQFALAVDSVEDHVCEVVRNLLMRHLIERCEAQHFEVLMDGIRVDGLHGQKPGLQTKWTSGQSRSFPLFTDDGEYRGQTAFAYHRNTKLWVTCQNDKSLNDPDADYLDLWSEVEDLPPYIAPNGASARTSILIPLSYGGRVFGVAFIEFAKKLSCTAELRAELDLMFAALARIIWLNHTTNNQLEDTKAAIEKLETSFGQDRSLFDQPSLFFAASSRADKDVIDVIHDVLKEKTEDRVQLVIWDEMHKSGPIGPEIIRAISTARYGVCYLSEPLDGEHRSEQRYDDNENVLFEAGMFEALTADPDAGLKGWIPIREEWPSLTDDPPFDIAGHRMVVVPRVSTAADGEAVLVVDSEALHEQLSRQIESLFEIGD